MGNKEETSRYRYDANGNQILWQRELLADFGSGERSAGFGGPYLALRVMKYNGQNQLESILQDDAKIEYRYRPDGMRYEKKVGGETTTHLWDGANIVGDSKGGSTTSYIRGLQLVASTAGEYYLYDGHGDVVQLTDEDGAAGQEYQYDAFGNQRQQEGQAGKSGNPFSYTGEYFDEETGFYYLRNRYYNPQTGRFINEDSAQDGLNWYIYCANNPVKFVDPTGLLIYVHHHSREKLSSKSERDALMNDFYELTGVEYEITDGWEIKQKYAVSQNQIKYNKSYNLVNDLVENPNKIIWFSTNTMMSRTEPEHPDGEAADWTKATNGTGTGVVVEFTPGVSVGGYGLGKNESTKIEEGTLTSPMILAHELIHAERITRGVAINPDEYALYNYVYEGAIHEEYFSREEYATIGIYADKNARYAENEIRLEHGVPMRFTYDTLWR